MSHQSEECKRLENNIVQIADLHQLNDFEVDSSSVYLFHFPMGRTDFEASRSQEAYQLIYNFCLRLHKDATVSILTTPPEAARLLPILEKCLEFKLWVAVKTTPHTYVNQKGKLPERHAALLILTRYSGTLRHTKTRVKYTYCPSCKKTTKDYGGKKHTYHEYGTLISDVWRDIECNPCEDIEPISDLLQDLFGLEPYKLLQILDLRTCKDLLPVTELPPRPNETSLIKEQPTLFQMSQTLLSPHLANANEPKLESRLLNMDCLEGLRSLPTESVDFCFADPPYNLQKKYSHWNDSMETIEYFAWCDQWLSELARILKPGKTLAVMNIPLWSVRYYQHLCSRLNFQAWIVWDAISFPVRQIMPSHYPILCFSKGEARALPGLQPKNSTEAEYLAPLGEFYCLRESCLSQRQRLKASDRGELSDLWYDIHRLKHNSYRVDHPCQLPPMLMRRLFTLFTLPGEVILDCFNGAGTSTLVAQEMGRGFIGIELSLQYHTIAQQRHEELQQGKNPFGKREVVPDAKNSRVERLPKQHYMVSKKILQLDVKRIAQEIGRLPTREEVKTLSKYPIEYFDNYFIGWGEVCAAARTTGMSDLPVDQADIQLKFQM